jgi:tetratricopeptide (TPR) repeat protein
LVKAAVYFVDPLAERATWAFNDYEEDDQKRISTDEWIDTKDLAKRVREHGDGLPKSNVMEALATLEAAINYRQAGKYTKAQRLLDHALALAPSDPDILTE